MDYRIASDQEREWAGQPTVDVPKLATLTIQPGDTLIMKVNTLLSEAARQRLRDEFTKHLPGVKVVLLDRDVDIVGVKKGEAPCTSGT